MKKNPEAKTQNPNKVIEERDVVVCYLSLYLFAVAKQRRCERRGVSDSGKTRERVSHDCFFYFPLSLSLSLRLSLSSMQLFTFLSYNYGMTPVRQTGLFGQISRYTVLSFASLSAGRLLYMYLIVYKNMILVDDLIQFNSTGHTK